MLLLSLRAAWQERESSERERESGRKLLTYMLLICFHDLNVRLSPIGSTHTHKRTQTHANARTERQRERREENARESTEGAERARVCARVAFCYLLLVSFLIALLDCCSCCCCCCCFYYYCILASFCIPSLSFSFLGKNSNRNTKRKKTKNKKKKKLNETTN